MDLKNKKIVFCFPYKVVGGVSLLFLRLATLLRKNGYDAAIVDYKDGDMAKNREKGLPLIIYADDKVVQLPKNSIVVFQSMTPWSIFPNLEISNDSNIFFITTMPQNFYPLLPGKLRLSMSKGALFAKFIWHTLLLSDYLKVKKFISILESRSSVVYLDEDIVCNLRQSFNIKIDSARLMPLFSQDVNRNIYLTEHKVDCSVLKLGWIGRLSDFKINILNRVLEDAFVYSTKHQKKIIFNIIGTGEFATVLKSFKSQYFSIVKIDYVPMSDLAFHMLQYNMVFAMGTAALDAARLGVPTVRLDYSFQVVADNYLYKMLYDAKGFSLAERIGSKCFNVGEHSFNDLMISLISDHVLCSKKCFDFYSKNHSIENSSKLFLKNIYASRLKWGELKNSKVLNSGLYDFWNRARGCYSD